MTSPTDLHLPHTFPYPIKVVSLDVNPAASISRGTRLLSYSFVYHPPGAGSMPETRFGTWDSATEGVINAWNIKKGDTITERRAREQPVISVTEPCKHGVQIGGLCGLCGKDMTDYDYTGYSDASRASIQMTHSAFGPTVSLEEAQRIERETAEHLRKSRRLSLIVDLDQTIVHATVDPTVGEWIAEGEAWEARQAKKAEAAKRKSEDHDDDDEDSSDTSSDSDEDDECNPNWAALKDVKRFRLGLESFGFPLPRGHSKGKQSIADSGGCIYYVKPRPGWQTFLREISKKYEMHVYTMGTRAYAEEVCSAIDPDGSLFGGRVLSRDESGSLTQKSLRRLFPCDTSMVVVIDDRADVWEWSPNLVKVIPYDFFVGIGDINSAFLPKVETLGSTPSTPSVKGECISPVPSSSSSSPSLPEEPIFKGSDSAEPTAETIPAQTALALEAQLAQRPLAKKQEELEEAEAKLTASSSLKADDPKGTEQLEPQKPEKVVHKALLKNDDAELERLSKLLDEVHRRFYAAFDSWLPDNPIQRRKLSSSSKSFELPQVSYDVTRIIPRMRSEVLEGVHIVFSSVIPLDTVPETTEIWRLAHMFGATCHAELVNSISHVVATRRGTVKVDAARKRVGIKIVHLSWLTDSIALWRRQDEALYLLDDPSATVGPSSSPTAEYHQISSDPDPDTDDWDSGGAGDGDQKPFAMDDINWADINDEVEAAMNESDEECETGSRLGGLRSGYISESEPALAGDGALEVPRAKGRRPRSRTPSEIGLNGESVSEGSRSTKRRKIEHSKLKEAILADDLEGVSEPHVSGKSAPASPPQEQEDEEDDGSEEEDDVEDDFLARELEEELG